MIFMIKAFDETFYININICQIDSSIGSFCNSYMNNCQVDSFCDSYINICRFGSLCYSYIINCRIDSFSDNYINNYQIDGSSDTYMNTSLFVCLSLFKISLQVLKNCWLINTNEN